MKKPTAKDLDSKIRSQLLQQMCVWPGEATREQVYRAVCGVVRGMLAERAATAQRHTDSCGKKVVYYLSMEFLPGTQLHNNVFNMGIESELRQALADGFCMELKELYEQETDAGLGNGGLGRLASCYLDALTGEEKHACGMSLCYEHGIFKQKICDCRQTEEADDWLRKGECWLVDHPEDVQRVELGQTTVLAFPRDLMVAGYGTDNVNFLRLWESKPTAEDEVKLPFFAEGKYEQAMEHRWRAEMLTQILYPEDGHVQGKLLRLSQQYFLASASMQYAVKKHVGLYGTVENFHEKNAVHINDTHPTLAIPELMRLFIDDYGLDFDKAWSIVNATVSYTNHTVLPEALEKWPRDIMQCLVPRICEIIDLISDMLPEAEIASDGEIRMANLCVAASHKVNGVSAIHSGIIKDNLFAAFSTTSPEKFTNVTNGIAYRRWLCQANPLLTDLITELIGDEFKTDAGQLQRLRDFADDRAVLQKLRDIKRSNKLDLVDYIKEANGIVLDADSIFDVQVKRLHEYKRQLLNIFHIMHLCTALRENPNADVRPQTFIFGAKAASGYAVAKDIISLACCLSEEIERDPILRSRIRVVFLENYSVSLSELVMPAAEVSEQISLAGKEASGTGNMKLMINGAVTLGTEDGANVEIHRAVGDDNIFIFGMSELEVREFKALGGYVPLDIIEADARLKEVVHWMRSGVNGKSFSDLVDSLTNVNYSGMADQYLVVKEFDAYVDIQKRMRESYAGMENWQRMSLTNIAGAGMFSADRAVLEYAANIWGI